MKARYGGISYKPITDEQISAIVESCGDVNSYQLRRALDEAAEQFIHAHYEQQTFPHAELENRLADIVSGVGRLQKLLHQNGCSKRRLDGITRTARRLCRLLTAQTSDSFELESILNVGHTGEKEKARRESFGGDVASLVSVIILLGMVVSWRAVIPDISCQLDLLKRVASHAALIQNSQKEKSKSRHKGDTAFSALLAGIRQSYMAFCYMWPSVSRNSGNPDGVFMDFVFSVINAINDNLSKAVRDSDPEISEALTKTPEAIYAKIREQKNF